MLAISDDDSRRSPSPAPETKLETSKSADSNGLKMITEPSVKPNFVYVVRILDFTFILFPVVMFPLRYDGKTASLLFGEIFDDIVAQISF